MTLQTLRDVSFGVIDRVQRDRLLTVAGGVAFFSLFALVPAISAFLSLYGLFADVDDIIGQLGILGGILPADSLSLVVRQFERLASHAQSTLTLAFTLSLGISLWSANAAAKTLFEALNLVRDQKEERGFIELNLTALAFTLGMGAFFVLATFAVAVTPLILGILGLRSFADSLLAALRWPFLLAAVIVGLGIAYRMGPSGAAKRRRWISAGTILASLTWLTASFGFSWYLANLADYDAVYGSLGAVMGLMMWLWISALVVLLGTAVDVEMEARDQRYV